MYLIDSYSSGNPAYHSGKNKFVYSRFSNKIEIPKRKLYFPLFARSNYSSIYLFATVFFIGNTRSFSSLLFFLGRLYGFPWIWQIIPRHFCFWIRGYVYTYIKCKLMWRKRILHLKNKEIKRFLLHIFI